MRESAGKTKARHFLFKECLPNWLSKEELKNGKYLLLLGENPKELQYLDGFEVERSYVYSVERELDVYKSQLNQNLGAHLWNGELVDYLTGLLNGNDDFLFFNLDVEGSYLSQIDAAMTPVMLFSWRNPKTVIASYSSVGRDSEMVWEGIKSLVIFLWLDRERTEEVFSVLINRYKSAHFGNPVFMVLRDLFWLRSILEHSLVASTMVGVTAPTILKRWLDKVDLLWEGVSVWKRKPLRFQNLLSALDIFLHGQNRQCEAILELPPCVGNIPDSFRHIVYNAEMPWSQLCYFTTFRVLPSLISIRKWLAQSLEMLISEPLVYFDRDGKKHILSSRSRKKKVGDTVLWRNNSIYEKFRPRQIGPFLLSRNLALVARANLAMRGNSGLLNEGKEKDVKKFIDNRGKLTDLGKAKVQQCARDLPNSSTQELVRFLPKSLQKVPIKTIVAHVAVGRRGLAK